MSNASPAGLSGGRAARLEVIDGGVLRLSGRVPHSREILQLREQGYRLLREREVHTNCTIDLAHMDGAGSVPLSLLLSWYRYGRSLGLELRFQGAPEGMQAMAAVSGLAGLFHASPETAPR